MLLLIILSQFISLKKACSFTSAPVLLSGFFTNKLLMSSAASGFKFDGISTSFSLIFFLIFD